jgi:CRISPR-associated protein Csb2
MPDFLRLTVRFIDGVFHGRGDGGVSEWPPSPLRVFQALVAASAGRWNERREIKQAASALRWLEALPPPEIVAAPATMSAAYQLYVPNNVGDLVGKRWEEGNDGDFSAFRTEKMVRAVRLGGDGEVHFVWRLPEAPPADHLQTLCAATRSITHLGWGTDLVVAEGAILSAPGAAALGGQKWLPTEAHSRTTLRAPVAGSLRELQLRHKAFLSRLDGFSGGKFSPVPPLRAYRQTNYKTEFERPEPGIAVFALRSLDDSAFRSFNPVRRGLHVAAMVRHVAGGKEMTRSLGWSESEASSFVHGHSDAAATEGPSGRLLFLPLPSVEPRGRNKANAVGEIRRVLLATSGPAGLDTFQRLVRRLAGAELIDEKAGPTGAMLARLPDSDGLTQRNYLAPATTWATVSPVALPGYDDPRKLRQRLNGKHGLTSAEKAAILNRLEIRTEQLLRKAIRQAGFSEAIAKAALIEWQGAGFLPGVDLAARYMAGDQHRRYRKLHVRIQFRDAEGQPLAVSGPIALGGGRFSGTGLFARVE